MATDKQLLTAIREAITTGLTARGVTGIEVKQAYQPTQQGIPSGPTIFFSMVGFNRFGYPRRESRWVKPPEVVTSEMRHTESQWYEHSFQVDALSIQDPSDLSGMTAADLVDLAQRIMMSDATRAYLRTQGIGIYRSTEARNPSIIDDKGRFEATPSFDFTLTHQRVDISTDPVVESFVFNLNRV